MASNNYSSTIKAPSQRQRRAGELVRHVLAEIIQREEVHDPDLPQAPITITEVKVSPDLRNATVFCTVLGQSDSSAAVATLNNISGRIRSVLAGRIEMKYTPALRFKADDSFEEAAKIDALLAQSRQNGQ